MIPHFVGVQELINHQGYNHLNLHALEPSKHDVSGKLSILVRILRNTIFWRLLAPLLQNQ